MHKAIRGTGYMLEGGSSRRQFYTSNAEPSPGEPLSAPFLLSLIFTLCIFSKKNPNPTHTQKEAKQQPNQTKILAGVLVTFPWGRDNFEVASGTGQCFSAQHPGEPLAATQRRQLWGRANFCLFDRISVIPKHRIYRLYAPRED